MCIESVHYLTQSCSSEGFEAMGAKAEDGGSLKVRFDDTPVVLYFLKDNLSDLNLIDVTESMPSSDTDTGDHDGVNKHTHSPAVPERNGSGGRMIGGSTQAKFYLGGDEDDEDEEEFEQFEEDVFGYNYNGMQLDQSCKYCYNKVDMRKMTSRESNHVKKKDSGNDPITFEGEAEDQMDVVDGQLGAKFIWLVVNKEAVSGALFVAFGFFALRKLNYIN